MCVKCLSNYAVIPHNLRHLFACSEHRPLQIVIYVPFGCRGGSRLPTRSNRKTIATGNLRPRRPINANEHNKISQMITKNITPILGAIKGIALAIPCLGIWQAYTSPASLRVSPCRYHRRVDCTNSSTSNTLSLLYIYYITFILICKVFFYFLLLFSILYHQFS